MIIKKVIAKIVKDSRGEKTIKIIVKTGLFKRFKTSAPSGESKGKYEVKSYAESLKGDVEFINHFNIDIINNLKLKKFEDLIKLENIIEGAVGGNTLFALEANLLKALAGENNQELYEFLGKGKKLPRPIGNAVGGGVHSKGVKDKKPDFQEFLFIGDSKTIKECVKTNELAYKLAGKLLKARKTNDEGAWETDKSDEEVLDAMQKVQNDLKKQGKNIKIGVDVASSSFYAKKKYNYQNTPRQLNKSQQINYIKKLIKKYKIYYAEDVLEENDFSGFSQVNKVPCFIVGDDLTTTNPERLKKAIRMKSINAIIVKPNQIGSLIKTKRVIDLANQNKIKTIISHRSGETMDDTIADLGVSWDCDFIKTGIYGDVRKSKLDRLIDIEEKLNKKI